MVKWSIEAFRACDSVHSIVVAVPPGHARDFGGRGLDPGGGDLCLVDGGATRSRSVANALAAVETELVAIHDAARPLLTPALVEELVARLAADPEAAGVIAATPVIDTIKQADNPQRCSLAADGAAKEQRKIERTLDRLTLWAAQTPQVFRADALRAALAVDAEVRDTATDEAMLVEAAGGTVLIHPTSPENLKVTTPLDLRVAELLLAERVSP
jgi:2-C-methyl-D-erythritol 4-phosphate cytidylyltransferase